MKKIEAPKANPERLMSVVSEAYDRKIVVPEFQRSFVWTRDDIEQLLASVLQGYFVGTFLLLDTPADKPMFPFRTVDGLSSVTGTSGTSRHNTVRLVLDGQQRITSIFYALYQPPIPLKNARYPHKFYLRLDYALNGNLDEAITGISTRDTRRMSEMNVLVNDDKALPLSLFTDASRFYEWLYTTQKVWHDEKKDIQSLYDRFANYMVPVVGLELDSSRDNVVNIFERINRTGVSLSLFDLAGARLYLKGVKLRDLWSEFEKELGETHKSVIRPDFLIRLIALLQGKEPRKGNLLDAIDSLDPATFQIRWSQATDGISRAASRIAQEYGSFSPDWIPYSTLAVPLGAILLDARSRHMTEDAYRKIDCWYWSSVLSQRYDSAVDTKSYQDVRAVREWMSGGTAPDWISRLSSDSIDMRTDEPRSAVYRGLMCLTVKEGSRDFLTGQPAPLNECHDDHIFPKSKYAEYELVNSVLNRTMISKETNLSKKDKIPSEFIGECLIGHGDDEARLLETLASHFISADAYHAILDNDFEKFIEERRRNLSKRVAEILSSGSSTTLVDGADAR